MFDLFKKDKENKPQDVKGIRHQLVQFIKQQLSKAEGGEGGNIKGLCLFIACPPEEKHMYEAAVYFDEEGRFQQEEVQKISDDFALNLPPNWTMEILFPDTLPPDAQKVPGLDAALFVKTGKRSIQKHSTAYIFILNGQAEKEMYTLTSSGDKINIGREKKVQADDGFLRINHIAFPGDSKEESNKYISRQHAHIQFDNESGNFLFFADEGGVPPRNKIKIRSQDNQTPVKMHSTGIAHVLHEGDQIILGESALIAFSYKNDAF